jgi:hypothetical protein
VAAQGAPPLSAGRERVRMTSLHFSIGRPVVYRIGLVNQGPFVIVSVIVQPRHGIRYAMRKTAVIGKSVQEGARRQASEARCST